VPKSFAVFDIDGTLIRWQLYHAVADALAKNGHINSDTYAKIRDARMRWKKRIGSQSFSDYQMYVIKAYEDVLLSLNAKHLNEAVEDVFDEYKDQVYTYTRDYIKKLKKRGYSLFAISGSQTEIIKKITDYYGFDDYAATEYIVIKRKLRKIFPSEDKKKALNDLVARNNVSFRGSIGVGDSAGDIPMLEMVEMPIAFNPEKSLFDYASKRRWRLVVERKNVVYQLNMTNNKYELAKTDH